MLGRTVMAFLLDDGLPPGPVLLAGDDTVTEPPGPNVFGKGRHRDGVRSPHRSTADRWGHTGVGIAGLVPWPVAPRPWALPVLVALDRPPAWARMQGTRHQTPAHMGRLLLARLIRGFPERHVVFGGDSRDGTSATARLCQKPRQPLTLVRTLYGEAAVYELPPPRPRHPIGRPRVKGQPRASPQEVVAHVTPGTRLTVAWDGARPEPSSSSPAPVSGTASGRTWWPYAGWASTRPRVRIATSSGSAQIGRGSRNRLARVLHHAGRSTPRARTAAKTCSGNPPRVMASHRSDGLHPADVAAIAWLACSLCSDQNPCAPPGSSDGRGNRP